MNRRILVIDDNAAIHADFQKIFGKTENVAGIDDMESKLFGTSAPVEPNWSLFKIDYALQGKEGCDLVRAAKEQGEPYALAFVDVRMPPGLDGLETSLEIWKVDPQVQIVLCTAYSDYTWEETLAKLGAADRFLILKKPFDTAEVRQLAQALTEKWRADFESRGRLDELSSKLEEEAEARKQLEAALRQAQKLQMLGQMVGGVAHEISNPLSFVMDNLTYLESALRNATPGKLGNTLPEMRAAIRDTSDGVGRIREIVAELKNFARKDSATNTKVDVHRVLDSALKVAGPHIRSVGSVVRKYGVVPDIFANSNRLGQVFLNLLMNAAQALPEERVNNQIQISTESMDEWVDVEISDNGVGIPAENLEKIFEPLFTTKAEGVGTGLGLTICKQLIEAQGGEISVRSQVGQGSSFRVRLPVTPVKA